MAHRCNFGKVKKLAGGTNYEAHIYLGHDLGLTEGRLYNLKGELTDQTLGSENRNYTYDLNGNLVEQVRAGTSLYTYDALDRLTQETSASIGQLAYSYDPTAIGSHSSTTPKPRPTATHPTATG